MKARWNWLVWAGFAVALLAAFSYIPFFSRFPVSRDFPWANLLLFVFAGCLLAVGVRRAFTQPERYRGKISGSILAVLSVMIFALFSVGMYYASRSLPMGATVLRAGQQAPDFSLTDADGKAVTLAQL